MNKQNISASILSANFACLGEEVTKVLAAGADIIHFDVMDNHYVPNLTFGAMVCQALRDFGITAPIDVHLMTKPVDSLVAPFAKAGASYISFHPEATEHIDRTIQLIHSYGCKAGLAFNPATPLNYLDHVLEKLEMVLIMSVNPGFGGQQFIPEALTKIKAVKKLCKNKEMMIAVDGGINADTIGAIAKAGANTFVAGSAIFKAPDYQAAIAALRNAIK